MTPKEEPKCTCNEHDPYCCQIHGSCPTCVKKEEPKQERMYSEEEVKMLAFNFYYDMSHKMGVAENLISENRLNVEEWFQQFKKTI